MSSTSHHNRRLLFLSPLLAMPSQHGGCVYPHALLQELRRQDFAVDYGWLGAPLLGGRRWMRPPPTAFATTSWVRGTMRLGPVLIPSTLGGWLGRKEQLPYDPSRHGGEHLATAAERRFAARLVGRLRPRHVLVDTIPMLGLFDELTPDARRQFQVGVLTHNLIHRRTELYRDHHQPLDFLPLTEAEETALLGRADFVIAIQEREAEAFRRMLPGKRVITVPMPLRPRPLATTAETPGRALFVGGYSGHNIAAVQWLNEEIWPRVRRAVPEAELVVAGTVGRAVVAPAPGVRVAGPVGNLENEYAAAGVCLVPLPLGTGLKIKLVEAMGYGRAVVTTPAGAEGFAELEAGRVAVVAADAATFADQVARLLLSAPERAAVVQRQLAWLGLTLAPEAALAPLTELL